MSNIMIRPKMPGERSKQRRNVVVSSAAEKLARQTACFLMQNLWSIFMSGGCEKIRMICLACNRSRHRKSMGRLDFQGGPSSIYHKGGESIGSVTVQWLPDTSVAPWIQNFQTDPLQVCAAHRLLSPRGIRPYGACDILVRFHRFESKLDKYTAAHP